jgi:hypothetical protein
VAAAKNYGLTSWAVVLVLFAFNLAILLPHLTTDLSVQPWTTEYNFAALARLFRSHAWGWNPFWYGGFPFSYAYPPLFHIAAAAIPFTSAGHAYHLVSGIGYCLVPVAVFVFGKTIFHSSSAAAFAALAYSIFPSSMYFFPALAGLASKFSYAPWQFVTLVEYGEGPHHAALAVVLFSIAAAWKGRWLLATILFSAVLLTNWPGSVAVAIGLTAVGLAKASDLGFRKAATTCFTVAATAYGLAAFWITPGYLYTTAMVAQLRLYEESPPKHWDAITLGLILAAILLTFLAVLRRLAPKAIFLLVWTLLFALPVTAYYLLGNHLVPEPWRFSHELNLGIILSGRGTHRSDE